MKDKTGFFAALSDSLCCVCVYWVVASTMVMSGRGWTMGLFWPLLWTVLCTAAFARVLAKPRSFNAMFLLAAGAAGLALALFIAVAATHMTGLHIFTLAVGAGMASGLPMYYLVKRPTVHGHLTCLDVLLLAFAWFLLTQAGQDAAGGAAFFMAAVLVLAVGAAVGLRMGSDSGAEGAKAMGVALASAALLAFCVMGLIALFSRSGELTGSIVRTIGNAFRWLGGGLSWLMERFASLFEPQELEAVTMEGGVSGVVIDSQVDTTTSSDGSIWPAIVLAALVVGFVVVMMTILRKTKLTLGTEPTGGEAAVSTGSIRMAARERWQAWLRAFRFRVTALLRRDTPPGVFVCYARYAARRKQGRQNGETARQFLRRMAPDGTLDALADDLDSHWYGGRKYTLTAAQCRALRQKIQG